MATLIKYAIILYKCFATTNIISNAVGYQFSTGFAFVIRVMYMWQLKQSAIDGAIFGR